MPSETYKAKLIHLSRPIDNISGPYIRDTEVRFEGGMVILPAEGLIFPSSSVKSISYVEKEEAKPVSEEKTAGRAPKKAAKKAKTKSKPPVRATKSVRRKQTPKSRS